MFSVVYYLPTSRYTNFSRFLHRQEKVFNIRYVCAHSHLLFTGRVGIALNGEWYEPLTDSKENKAAAEMAMQFVVCTAHPY
jgi:hypothetical protein